MRKKYWVILTVIILAIIGIFLLTRIHNNKVGNLKPKPTSSYVAIGDSVSAGVGLLYDSDSTACDRTNQSYPYLLSTKYNYSLFNLSCSGATFRYGINGSMDVNKLTIQSQINQLKSLPRPKIITLTAGADDLDWTQIISSCYISNCQINQNPGEFQAKLNLVQTGLKNTLNSLKSIYKNSPPKIYITGYYNPFPSSIGSSCPDLKNLNSDKLAYLKSDLNDLNQVLRDTSKDYSTTKFVPLDFSGHELCSDMPYVKSLTDSAPYHPTLNGQQYIADQITKMT